MYAVWEREYMHQEKKGKKNRKIKYLTAFAQKVRGCLYFHVCYERKKKRELREKKRKMDIWWYCDARAQRKSSSRPAGSPRQRHAPQMIPVTRDTGFCTFRVTLNNFILFCLFYEIYNNNQIKKSWTNCIVCIYIVRERESKKNKFIFYLLSYFSTEIINK